MRSLSALLYVFVVILLSAADPAQATMRTWPGGFPCDTTLQACITGASTLDVIEIASNGTISESLTIDKSLTLHPATGYTPTISGFTFLQSTSWLPTSPFIAGGP